MFEVFFLLCNFALIQCIIKTSELTIKTTSLSECVCGRVRAHVRACLCALRRSSCWRSLPALRAQISDWSWSHSASDAPAERTSTSAAAGPGPGPGPGQFGGHFSVAPREDGVLWKDWVKVCSGKMELSRLKPPAAAGCLWGAAGGGQQRRTRWTVSAHNPHLSACAACCFCRNRTDRTSCSHKRRWGFFTCCFPGPNMRTINGPPTHPGGPINDETEQKLQIL